MNQTGAITNVGAQDPELQDSPIAEESDEEFDVIRQEVEFEPLCYFNSIREPANKSNAFSAGYRKARCAKDSAVKCLDLFKLADKAGGRYRVRPWGLSERPDLRVNAPEGHDNCRRTTSMPVISMPSGCVVVISNLSESQRRIGLVRRCLSYQTGTYVRSGTSLLICDKVLWVKLGSSDPDNP